MGKIGVKIMKYEASSGDVRASLATKLAIVMQCNIDTPLVGLFSGNIITEL